MQSLPDVGKLLQKDCRLFARSRLDVEICCDVEMDWHVLPDAIVYVVPVHVAAGAVDVVTVLDPDLIPWSSSQFRFSAL